MARPARPSDLYRLPAHVGEAQQDRVGDGAPDAPSSSQRRRPAAPLWIIAVAAAAAVLLAVGIIRGFAADAPGGGATPPTVDVAVEDEVVAALGVFLAEAEAADVLGARSDVYAPPGPGDAATAARAGLRRLEEALTTAFAVPDASPAAAGYWRSPDHERFRLQLLAAADAAEEIALLAAAHDTLYDGSGAVPLRQAQQQMTSLFAGTSGPRAAWAAALLGQIDGEDRRAAAEAARADAAAQWQTLSSLEPAARPALDGFLAAVPAGVRDALRGHPVAGPALARLEHGAP